MTESTSDAAFHTEATTETPISGRAASTRSSFDAIAAPDATALDLTKPLRLHSCIVPSHWVDYNGHMNDSRYFLLSSETGDRFLRFLGIDGAYLANHMSYFTVESHINFVAQSRQGDALYATMQLLSHDAKRMRLFCSMHRADTNAVVATAEHMMLHVDTQADRACAASPAIIDRLNELSQAQAALSQPPNAGRAIGSPRR